MVFLFGMELNDYLSVSTSTSITVDKSSDGEFLRIDFNISFPALSCEFASVDVNDVLGTNRLNITKSIRKFSIDPNLKPTGSEFHAGPIPGVQNHGDETEEEYGDGSLSLTSESFDGYSHSHSVLVVNFYAPWCYWSNRLKPSWEKAAKIISERYDPEMDGRIVMGKVDCTQQGQLCRRHHIQGYPSIRIFRKGSDIKDNHGHHDHESYYGERDTESLVAAMETLVAAVPRESNTLAAEENSNMTANTTKHRPAPLTSGCRVEGFVRVKRVPGNLVFSARSTSHSFDASQINVSHVIAHFSFGKKLKARTLMEMKRLLPYLGGSHDRLSGQSYIISKDTDNSGSNVTIEHYLQLVKTEVVSRRYSQEHSLLEEYEYTSHSSLMHSVDIPVAKFHYEPSAMQVIVTEVSKSFSHFLTNICAIIGGIFTVAGIMDSILHNTMRLVKKVELGKHM